MKREGDRRSVAPPPAPRVHRHPVEAEPVDGVDAREAIKPGNLPSTVSKKPCVADVDANANARRPDVADPPNGHGIPPTVKWGVSRLACLSGFSKPAIKARKLLGSIKPNVPSNLAKNADGTWNPVNANAMRGNRLIVPSCEKSIKEKRRVLRWTDHHALW